MIQFVAKNCSGKFKESYTEDQKMTAKQKFFIALTLSMLFGLGWGVGLFATQDLHQNSIIRDLVSSIFIILTAFQGLFIFIMHCVRSAEVRKQWNIWFHQATCRNPPKFSVNSSYRNSKFSRTASTTTNVSFISQQAPHRMTTVPSQIQVADIGKNSNPLNTTRSNEGSVSFRVPSMLDLGRYEKLFGSQVSISSYSGSTLCHAVDVPEGIEMSYDCLDGDSESTQNYDELEARLSHLPNPLMTSNDSNHGVIHGDDIMDDGWPEP